MTFAGLLKHSLIDYPGFISCVVFVPGCNYDCYFCHNRHLLEGEYDILPPTLVYDFLHKRKGLIDAVVITGGEPTLQQGLTDFIKKVKSMGYRIKLDTNGAKPDVVKALLDENLLDYAAVDYKAPAELYSTVCGDNITALPVKNTIDILMDSGISFEVRTTVLPELTEKELTQMAVELPLLPCYRLNRYRKPQDYPPEFEKQVNKRALSNAEICSIAERLKQFQPNIQC